MNERTPYDFVGPHTASTAQEKTLCGVAAAVIDDLLYSANSTNPATGSFERKKLELPDDVYVSLLQREIHWQLKTADWISEKGYVDTKKFLRWLQRELEVLAIKEITK